MVRELLFKAVGVDEIPGKEGPRNEALRPVAF
jgi:hypothetical protein